MILLERLNEIDDNEYVYLGAKEGNGFIFIGTAKDARATLNDISEDYFAKEKKRLKEAKSRLEKADEMIASLPNAILAEDDDNKREISDLLSEFDKYESLEDLKTDLNKINTRNPKLEKWDCYKYCQPNMEIIAHEVIRQYKEQIKKKPLEV